MPALIYIADPMCSWCYGFGPELSTLMQGLPDIPVELVLGGLRAGNREVMSDALKSTLLSHWQQVGETSGLPFSHTMLSQKGFIYDTEPACRAVVTARMLTPQAGMPVFQAIQHAFYAGGLDVTQGDVLAQIASAVLTQAGFPISALAFYAKWSEVAAVAATAADFRQTRQWEISGFPTLVLARNGSLDLVTSGFMRTEAMVERMQAIIDQPA